MAVEDISGDCNSFLVVRPWTQFFKPEQRDDMPLSTCNNISFKNIRVKSKNFFDVGKSDKYRLTDFSFTDCEIEDTKKAFDSSLIENCTVKNLVINGEAMRINILRGCCKTWDPFSRYWGFDLILKFCNTHVPSG